MSLIVCIECRKIISSGIRKCPHCGAPIALSTVSWVAGSSGSRKGGSVLRVAKYVLLIVVLGGAWWIWQAATSSRKAPFSAGFSAAFREPRKIADERFALKPGQHVSYALALETDSRVHIRVTSVADPVDMMLIPRADAEKFRGSGGDLFGKGYSGLPAFSERQVGMLDKTEVVPKGDWALVLLRPKGTTSARAEAPAEVSVTVY